MTIINTYKAAEDIKEGKLVYINTAGEIEAVKVDIEERINRLRNCDWLSSDLFFKIRKIIMDN